MSVPPTAVVRIRPPRKWESLDIGAVWRFRGLVWALAARDITLRYRQTAMGVLWVVIQPLLGAGILSFVFGRVAKLESGGVPYMLFAYAGLLGWNLFSTTVLKASASLVGNASLISKVAFPRLVLPVSGVIGTLLDAAIALVVGAGLTAAAGVRPGLGMVVFPFWMALLVMFGLGVGLILAALAVAYRDVAHVLPVGLQLLLYASPVGYAVSSIPDGTARYLYGFNPLAPMLDGLRSSLLGTPGGDLFSAGYATFSAVGVLFIGLLIFRRRERRFADVI